MLQLSPVPKALRGSSPCSIGIGINFAGSSFKGSGDGWDSAHGAEHFISSVKSVFPSAEMAADLPNQIPLFKWALVSVNHTPYVLLGLNRAASCIGEGGASLSNSCGSPV